MTDYELTKQIKNIAREVRVSSGDGTPFFGKLTICFTDGKFSHMEKYETSK